MSTGSDPQSAHYTDPVAYISNDGTNERRMMMQHGWKDGQPDEGLMISMITRHRKMSQIVPVVGQMKEKKERERQKTKVMSKRSLHNRIKRK